jgi:O-acetyl-ADP-ribose deacetylase
MRAFAERVEVTVGDITKLKVDAIVNAANNGLLGGGGVDGAIHRGAGPELLKHNRTLGGCATGEAKVTPSFDLKTFGIQHIIHAVGPVWGSDPHAEGNEPLGYRLEDNQLGSCYQRALEIAETIKAKSIAFPCISTGVYGFPQERAARIAIGHVRAFLEQSELPERVIFCCFKKDDAEIYERLLIPTDYQKSIKIGDE